MNALSELHNASEIHSDDLGFYATTAVFESETEMLAIIVESFHGRW